MTRTNRKGRPAAAILSGGISRHAYNDAPVDPVTSATEKLEALKRNLQALKRELAKRVTADTITDEQIKEIEDLTDHDGRDIATEDYLYTTPEVSYYCAVALGDIKGDDIRTARKLCAEIYNAVKADR